MAGGEIDLLYFLSGDGALPVPQKEVRKEGKMTAALGRKMDVQTLFRFSNRHTKNAAYTLTAYI